MAYVTPERRKLHRILAQIHNDYLAAGRTVTVYPKRNVRAGLSLSHNR
jgi:hypothetical protein